MEAGNSPQPGMSPQPQPGGQQHRPAQPAAQSPMPPVMRPVTQPAMQPMSRRPSIDGFAPRRAHPGVPGGMLAQPQQMRQPSPTLAPQPAQPMRPQPVAPQQPRPVQPAPQPMHHVPVTNVQAPGHHPAMQTMHRPAGVATPGAAAPQTPHMQPQQPFGAQPGVGPTAGNAAPASRPAAFGAGSPAGASPAPAAPAAATTAPADEQSHAAPGHPREKNRTGHAGIIGFAVFILLGALLLSPFIPGTIIQDFPFASNTYSTGDSSLNCIGTQSNSTSTTSYDTKAGSPITYTYSTSTTQKATCGGQEQSATIGHTSQFNPLGLVIDILVAIVVAVVVARVWRMIFGEKKHRSHTPEL